MAIKVNGTTVVNNDRKGTFNVTNPGQFTTTERDALTPVIGDTIFNTTDGELQVWDGTEWASGGGGGSSGLAPSANSATLTENTPGNPRFTEQTFTTTVEMVQEGQPVSTKSIKGKLTADFSVYPETPDISDVTANTTLDALGALTVDNNTNINNVNAGTPFFTWVNPETQKVDCYYLKNTPNGDTATIYKASNNNLSSFTSIAGVPLNSPYASQASGAYTTPDEKYVNINIISQGQGLYVSQEQWLSGTYNISPNYQFELGEFRLRIGAGGSFGVDVYCHKKDENGNWVNQGSTKTLPGYSTWIWAQASVVGDNIIVTTNNNNNVMNIVTISKSFIENWSTSGTLPYQSINVQTLERSQVAHKGKLFISNRKNIYSYVPGASTVQTVSLPPLPSGSSGVAAHALWEDPYGYLICKQTSYQSSGNHTYTFYKSNNAGSTWALDPHYPSISTNYNGPDAIMNAVDVYWYGYRLTQFAKGSQETGVNRYSFGYQDVVVPYGGNLNQINLGDILRPEGVTNPRNYMLVDNITDNGDSTKTLRLRGFTSLTSGQKLSSIASTGTESAVKWLVITESTGLVTDMVDAEPEYIDIGPSTTVPISFGSTFPTGNAPDTDIPAGATIQTLVKTENTAGSSEVISNVLTPLTETITKPVISAPVSDPNGNLNQTTQLTFVAGDFEVSSNSITKNNVTWEVSTDSAFTSPMVDVKAYAAGNQTLSVDDRSNISLSEGNNYFVRVKFNGVYNSAAISSEYSDAVEFKAAKPAEMRATGREWPDLGNYFTWYDDNGQNYSSSSLTKDAYMNLRYQQDTLFDNTTYNQTYTAPHRGWYRSVYGVSGITWPNSSQTWEFEFKDAKDCVIAFTGWLGYDNSGSVTFSLNKNVTDAPDTSDTVNNPEGFNPDECVGAIGSSVTVNPTGAGGTEFGSANGSRPLALAFSIKVNGYVKVQFTPQGGSSAPTSAYFYMQGWRFFNLLTGEDYTPKSWDPNSLKD